MLLTTEDVAIVLQRFCARQVHAAVGATHHGLGFGRNRLGIIAPADAIVSLDPPEDNEGKAEQKDVFHRAEGSGNRRRLYRAGMLSESGCRLRSWVRRKKRGDELPHGIAFSVGLKQV